MASRLRPRVFVIGMANRAATALPYAQFIGKTPPGQGCRVNFILLNYPRTVAGGIQTSPDLSISFSSTNGREHVNQPIPAVHFTSPAGGRGFCKSQFIGLSFPPSAFVTIQISGFAAGPVPSSVSLALLCQLGWGFDAG